MRALRLHRTLYEASALDTALATLARYGRFERADDDTHFVVHVTCKTPARERQVTYELASHALGLTIRAGAR